MEFHNNEREEVIIWNANIILMCITIRIFAKKVLSFFFFCIGLLNTKQIQEMREFRIATRKTNPIHNDVPENTTFLLFDQPSGEANTRGTLITKTEEVAINAKTANWKAIVIFKILQATIKLTTYLYLIPHLINIVLKYKK